MDKWFRPTLKYQNWILSTCDLFPLIMSQMCTLLLKTDVNQYHQKVFGYKFNPNTLKSYKILQILQKLFPKHAAHGVAQSTYPIYRHGKACLSKQPPWRAAGDPCLARGRSQVRAPCPAAVLHTLFFLHPPFLPPSGDSFFCTFPTNPAKVFRVKRCIF